jgi:hypothetical protein
MFEVIDREIIISKKFLAFKEDSLDTEIEVILSKSLIITICSSYEEEIQKIIEKRLESCTDLDLTRFTLSILKGKQYLSYSDLKGKILDKFGESYVTKFESFTNPQIISDYDSLISGRHKGSHTTKFSGTFNDVVNYHNQGKGIIIAFQNTLKI